MITSNEIGITRPVVAFPVPARIADQSHHKLQWTIIAHQVAVDMEALKAAVVITNLHFPNHLHQLIITVLIVQLRLL